MVNYNNLSSKRNLKQVAGEYFLVVFTCETGSSCWLVNANRSETEYEQSGKKPEK